MPDIRDTDWAYAAGFVDGEGCIAITRSFQPSRGRFYYSVQVVLSNRERSVLEWCRDLWGGWVVANPGSTRTHRAQLAWNWRCRTGLSAQPFLMGISPYLRIKAPQLHNALAMIALSQRSRRTLGRRPLPPDWLAEQEALYWKQRELNHRGSGEFIRRPMHSPRKIRRARTSAPELS